MVTQLNRYLVIFAITLALSSRIQPVRSSASLGRTLNCVKCNPDTCGAPPSNCPNGQVLDRCNCCIMCGRGEGEFCGGDYNKFGNCGEGLECAMTSQAAVYGVCSRLVSLRQSHNGSPEREREQPSEKKVTGNSENEPKNEDDSKAYDYKNNLVIEYIETDRKLPIAQKQTQQSGSMKRKATTINQVEKRKSPDVFQEKDTPVKLTTEEKLKMLKDKNSMTVSGSSSESNKSPGMMMDGLPLEDDRIGRPNQEAFTHSKRAPDEKCAPECTQKFCEENPRALCSAKRQTHRKEKCADPCATTVCRACEGTFDPYKSCAQCPKSGDDKCIKDFGRCFRKGNLSVRRSNDYKGHLLFNCAVPTC